MLLRAAEESFSFSGVRFGPIEAVEIWNGFGLIANVVSLSGDVMVSVC